MSSPIEKFMIVIHFLGWIDCVSLSCVVVMSYWVNVSVKDENGNNLEIISLEVNKDHEKNQCQTGQTD